MSRLLWPLAVVVALIIGWATSGVTSKAPAVREIERLTQQVTTLQAKLRVAEEMAAAAGPVAASVGTNGRSSGRSSGPAGDRSHAAFAQEDRLVQESLARAAATERVRNPQAQGDATSASSDSKAKAAPPAWVRSAATPRLPTTRRWAASSPSSVSRTDTWEP